ncbi:Uracil-DNA glycosylase [Rhizobiales bacterium GAS191]|nr:Uracil-DNA glycosylase [Rhizobiales bacterium GAS191]
MSFACSYKDAFAAFLGDPRAAGWADRPRLVAAGAKAVALADAAVAAGKRVLPPSGDVFNALRLTPLDTVRVVILGQDPYPTPGHAHGLAFSVKAGVKPLPASLRNIFKELQADLGVDPPSKGELTSWAEHGVLLLNTALTVEAGKAATHMAWPWREMTREAITAVSQERKRVVFLLWGLKAQAFSGLIDTKRHLILASEHPSPLSAYRGFFGSKPFSRANAWLSAHGEQQIPWAEL